MDQATRPRIKTLADVEAIERQTLEDFLPVTDMRALFERSATLWGDRPALMFQPTSDPADDATVITHAELNAKILQAANLFRALGVGEGDAVAMLLPNIPQAHFTLWGAEIAGRACPINFLLNTEHIVHLVRAAGAELLVALGPDPDLGITEKALEVARQVPELNAVLLVEGEADEGKGIHDFDATLADQPAGALAFERDISGDTIAAYFHTGGTTGAPKLAQHTHGNQAHTSWCGSLFYDVRPKDVAINGFPLFHVAGSLVYGTSIFISGGCLLLPTRLGMRNTEFIANHWRFVEKYGVTMLVSVPTVMASLVNTPIGDADISAVRYLYTGGTPLPTELANAFEAEIGVPVRNILGMTESAGLVTIQPVHAPRVPGSTGIRLPFTEVKAAPFGPDGVDPSQTCAPNETGVIVLRGPNVGPGYTDEKRNAGAFEKGWLISGDLGHVDADGNLFVTGRSKDVIIRGGHNIDPAIIEEAVDTHPAVEMSAAVGQPDAYAGELPVVFVTLQPGKTATEAELLDYLAPRIAERPALPKRVFMIDEMPVTAVGKIYKPTLRLRALEAVYGAVLADLEDEGVSVRVEGIDRGGVLAVRLVLSGGTDCKGMEAAVAQRLRDFAISYEMQWE